MTIPKTVPAIQPDREIRQISDGWSSTPAVNIVEVPGPAVMKKPGLFPDYLDRQTIQINGGERLVLGDVLHILGERGITSIVAKSEEASAESIEATLLPIRSFNGSLSELLRLISRTSGVSVSWEDNALMVGYSAPYLYSVVQDPDVGKKITEELTGLGAKNVNYSVTSGLLSFEADWRKQRAIEEYMMRITEAMGTINLQIAVISVSLDKNSKTGFDWGGFNASNRKAAAPTPAAPTPVTDEGAGSETEGEEGDSAGEDESVVTTVVSSVTSGLVTSYDKNGISLVFNKRSFSLTGLFSMLREYGEARTTQNMVLKTLPGSEVKVRSGSSIPYISSATNNVSQSQSSTVSANSIEVDKAEAGLFLKLTPYLDGRSGIVTMSTELELVNLLGFTTFDNNGAEFKQPNEQRQEFNDLARLSLGETIVIGGIINEASNFDSNSLAGLENLPLGHAARDGRKEALFIVVRPTARLYRFDYKRDLKGNAAAVNRKTIFEGKEIDPAEYVTKDLSAITHPEQSVTEGEAIADQASSRNNNSGEEVRHNRTNNHGMSK